MEEENFRMLRSRFASTQSMLCANKALYNFVTVLNTEIRPPTTLVGIAQRILTFKYGTQMPKTLTLAF